MEIWKIAKALLLDDGFRKLYPFYLDAVKESKPVKNYHKVDLGTTDKDSLHNMLRKIRNCESKAKLVTKNFELDFDFGVLRGQENRIKTELNKRTAYSLAHPNSKLSHKEKRRIAAKVNHGNGKAKNR